MLAINIENNKRQIALLLHFVGEDTLDIFDTLPDTEAADGEDHLDKAVNAMTAHFAPKQNREYEVYKFRQEKQDTGEDITSYHTRLKRLAQTCQFADNEREIKTHIIQHCESSN